MFPRGHVAATDAEQPPIWQLSLHEQDLSLRHANPASQHCALRHAAHVGSLAAGAQNWAVVKAEGSSPGESWGWFITIFRAAPIPANSPAGSYLS